MSDELATLDRIAAVQQETDHIDLDARQCLRRHRHRSLVRSIESIRVFDEAWVSDMLCLNLLIVAHRSAQQLRKKFCRHT